MFAKLIANWLINENQLWYKTNLVNSFTFLYLPKKSRVICLLSLFVLGFYCIFSYDAVKAEGEPPVNSSAITPGIKKQSSSRNSGYPYQAATRVLAPGTAIVGKTIMDIVLDPNRKYDLPITLLTALPIYSTNGEISIPQNSLITALIQKRPGGDYITIDRIVYRGLNVEIPSQGRLIPAQVRPENYNNFIYPPKTKISSAFGAADQSTLVPSLLAIGIAAGSKDNGSSSSSSVTPLILGVLGIDVGIKVLGALLDSKPTPLPPLTEIQKDSLIVFTIEGEFSLPDTDIPATPLMSSP